MKTICETSAAVSYRTDVGHADVQAVRRIVESTGFFNAAEQRIAEELVQDFLAKGVSSGYNFLFAEMDGVPVGYSCYGPIDGTESSYDLFWIAVDNGRRGCGLGRRILTMTEELISAKGGVNVYVETSSKPLYAPTRAFYEKCGYIQEALLKDFYAPGDGKVIFVKRLTPVRTQ